MVQESRLPLVVRDVLHAQPPLVLVEPRAQTEVVRQEQQHGALGESGLVHARAAGDEAADLADPSCAESMEGQEERVRVRCVRLRGELSEAWARGCARDAKGARVGTWELLCKEARTFEPADDRLGGVDERRHCGVRSRLRAVAQVVLTR